MLTSKSSRGSARLVVTATCAAMWKTALRTAHRVASNGASRISAITDWMCLPWRSLSQARLRSTPGRESAS
jgi:hypothetical protein